MSVSHWGCLGNIFATETNSDCRIRGVIPVDSLIHSQSVFYFPIDNHILIRHFFSNNIMLNALDKLVQSKRVVAALDTIEIIGACSPVGSREYNLKLASDRCMALHSYLSGNHPQLFERFPVKFDIIGIDSLGYSLLKEKEPALTRKQIWDNLQYAAVRLKMKDGSYLIPYIDMPKETAGVDAIMHPQVVERRDTIFLVDTVRFSDTMDAALAHDKYVKRKNPLHFALKTNLLYDALLLPNLTFEWYLGKQWSLAVEGNWSWWVFGSRPETRWYHRIQVAGVELRRWFKSPYPLHGHALGVYAMTGDYDIRLFPKDEVSTGYLSRWSWSAGLSYAYSFPIARRFNLELGLAAGYVGGSYYKYNFLADERYGQRVKYNRSYIGPTRVNVSLVWLLGTGNIRN